MQRVPVSAMVGLLLLSLRCTPAGAHPLSLAECTEGGEFIRNAALARDNGVTREFFVGKLEEDLNLIRAFPPALRWFVQDAGDERLLTEAVLQVFDAPLKAEQHEAGFVSKCVAQSALAREGRDSI